MADTLIICDVDGALSPDLAPTAGTGGWDDWKVPRIRPRTMTGELADVWVSRTMGRTLAAVGDIVWLTSWDERANKFLSYELGWPSDLPVIPWRPAPLLGGGGWASVRYGTRHHRWKADGLADWIAGGHLAARGWTKVVWVDDELADDGDIDRDVATRLLADAGVESLLVAPDDHVGLTVDHIEQIIDWVR